MALGRKTPFWSLFQQFLEGPFTVRLEALGFRRSRVGAVYYFRREQVSKFEKVSVFGQSEGEGGSVDVAFGIGFPAINRITSAKEMTKIYSYGVKRHDTCIGGNLFVVGGQPYDRWFLAPETDQDQLADEIEAKIKELGLPFSERIPTLEALVEKWLQDRASSTTTGHPFNPPDSTIACGLAATESYDRAIEFVENRIAEFYEIRRVKFNGHPKAKAEEISELEKLRSALQRLAKKESDAGAR